MSNDFAEFMVHTITVRALTGSGGMGDTYADPVTFSPGTGDAVMVDDHRRLVRSASGSEVTSESTIYDTDLAHAPMYAPGSEVTLPSGRVATVITTAVRDSGGLLPDHLEAACT